MHSIEFSIWFQSKALQHLKQSIQQFTQLMAEQIQSYNIEHKSSINDIPSEYLMFQTESCINSFKINILSELQQACFSNKFTLEVKEPSDKPIKLLTKNTLMQKARMTATAHALHTLPQLAFLDIETDGTDINTANILQIAIIKPVIDFEHNSLSYFTSWSTYVLPWESYTQKDNKAFHINHIGKEQLEKATDIEEALMFAVYHLCHTVIVGYNINNFDIPILQRHCEKHNEPLLHKYTIDLYPAIWKNKKQKLGDAIKAYNLPTNSNPHDAMADANCCIELLSEVIERNELPNNEEDLLELFGSLQNTWQHHYGRHKIIDINPDHKKYSHLLYQTPASSLKRKLSQISTSSRSDTY
jgi:DNA polymerase III epsilon subunit-like protein